MITRCSVILLCLACGATLVFAQSPTTTSAKLPPLLPREREIALALSAGPGNIRKDATVYVLERGGFVVAREGTNGFTCLVNRDRPDTLEPICFDPEGTRAILPRSLDAARWQEQGLSEAEVRAKVAEGFLTGKYRAPRQAGVAYMLSSENRVFNGEKVIAYFPHVMIYAPNLTNAEIGANMKNPRMPWVLEEGSPHAYIIVVVRNENKNNPQ